MKILLQHCTARTLIIRFLPNSVYFLSVILCNLCQAQDFESPEVPPSNLNSTVATQAERDVPKEFQVDVSAQIKSEMSQDEIRQIFGDPDNKQEANSPQSIETWHYGESLVMFSNSKVTAWVDHGDLEDRIDQQKFQKTNTAPTLSFEEKGWTNAWTPEKKMGDKEVIETILDDTHNEASNPAATSDKSHEDKADLINIR